MIQLDELKNAAFWDQAVCLDCGDVQGHLVEADDTLGPCDECNSDNVMRAKEVLRIWSLVEGEGEV